MKSVAITGHSKGIGQALSVLMQETYNVYGYSRSNGFDITNLDKIVNEIKTFDIFVNNAFYLDYQADLFNKIFDIWKHNPTKTIVNIISRAKYIEGTENPYYNSKIALSKLAYKKLFGRQCRIININPGFVMTESAKPSIEKYQMPFMHKEKCAEYILWTIEQPIEIFELSLWETKL